VAKLDGPRRPSVTRLEVEIIEEGSARVDGGHRVELTCVTTRPTFFAEASGQTIDEALDHALTRLARQIDRYRGKREARLTRAGRRPVGEAAFDEGSAVESGAAAERGSAVNSGTVADDGPAQGASPSIDPEPSLDRGPARIEGAEASS
jgi:ribosome-associated translation inhibitor RaiA